MKVVIVVGARPNFMKAAPIIAAIRQHNAGKGGKAGVPSIDPILVHTGQHYDAQMSDSFFADLNLPAPDVRLGVGSGSQAGQTAEILSRFEAVLTTERPDVVIVVGDVNSTVACALATAKTAFDTNGTRPILAHVEAGLRSFDRAMPEEINRVVSDHVSDLLFVTEESGVRNLRNEGILPEAIHFVGNTMIDSVLASRDKAEQSGILQHLNLRAKAATNGNVHPAGHFALLTLHRPSNVDNRETFIGILSGLEELAAEYPIVFPVHPRTRRQISEFGLEGYFGNGHAGMILTEPLGYVDFLCLMKHAAVVVTDSGGIQEETTCLGTPCVTVRENTERPVTIEAGTNVLAGTSKEGIAAAIRRQIHRKAAQGMPEFWDGMAALRIVDVLARAYVRKNEPAKAAAVQTGA